jgi:hypothetical protein
MKECRRLEDGDDHDEALQPAGAPAGRSQRWQRTPLAPCCDRLGALLCSEPAQPPLPSPLATRAPRSGSTWRQELADPCLGSVVTTSLPAYLTMLVTRWSRWVLLSTSRYTVPGWTNWCRLGIPAVASPAAAVLQVGGRQRGWPSPRRRATPSGAWLHETFTVATVDASSLRSTLAASGQTGRWHRER